MKEALQREGVDFEYLVVQDKAHLMTFIDHDANEKSYQFLIERMR
jgi:sugar/nucleoside kinase (ribokinase family)